MSSFNNDDGEQSRVPVIVNSHGEGLAASLETTLANAPSKPEFFKGSDESSMTSLTLTSLSTFGTSASPKTSVSTDNISALVFTEDEKNLLKNLTTAVQNDYPAFDMTKSEDFKFIPVIEAPGGTDKDPLTGLRRDSLPIARGVAATDGNSFESAILFFYDETIPDVSLRAAESNSVLRRFLLRSATGVIVRVNPGTLSSVAQNQLEGMLAELADQGIRIMTSPRVTRRMGAKDSLVKIRKLQCGLPDTYVYYDAESFAKGFLRSIAFRPRVIKQNRGSQGEGIWICKLADESQYCAKLGEKVATVDTQVVLIEANDNHVEYHTAGEFLEFAVNGRTPNSGTWASLGSGCYLDGGVEMGAMIVDQRFLPRISEGEVRCNMIGQELISLVHKVPQDGGVSATLQSGAKYTKYSPEDPKFAQLVKALKDDLPNIMHALDMADEPLPLLWTADFIFDTNDEGEDVFYVGEFNCSCVGITQTLELAEKVAAEAVSRCR